MSMRLAYLREEGPTAHDSVMSNIAHYRKLRGLTQEELARKVGTSQPHMSRLESGDDGPPLRLFKEIAQALGISLADLFRDDLSASELMLVEAFRRVPPQIQRSWLEMAKVAAAQPPTEGQ